MELHGVNLDTMTYQPVVVLRDPDEQRFLPIWIGHFEATAILMETQGIKPPRPLTHDLLKSVIENFNGAIERVVIDNLKDGTFYAKIHIKNGQGSSPVDARPSDAIALAVRTGTPIFVEEKVLEQAAVLSNENEEKQLEQFRDFLQTLSPEDFEPNLPGSS